MPPRQLSAHDDARAEAERGQRRSAGRDGARADGVRPDPRNDPVEELSARQELQHLLAATPHAGVRGRAGQGKPAGPADGKAAHIQVHARMHARMHMRMMHMDTGAAFGGAPGRGSRACR